MAYVPPFGFENCSGGECSPPTRVDGKWQCHTSGDCHGDECGCYLAVLAPGANRFKVVAKPKEPVSLRLPPGWSMVCVCVKKLREGPKKRAEKYYVEWERKDLGWIAPDGFKLKEDCPPECFEPSYDAREIWRCGEQGGNCFLVGVTPGDKRLHLFGNGGPSRPGEGVPERDIPPGWGIFCICLEKA